MDIQSTPSGEIVKMRSGYNAFVPYPLPPEIVWDEVLINTLSKANHLLGKLYQEGGYLPNPHLLIRPFVTREAVLSSKIEGTQTTIGEIFANDAGVEVDRDANDLQEVSNYIQALDEGIAYLQEGSLSLKLLRELHARLMKSVRGDHATPGEFRRTQNWIGIPGCTLTSARYVPPPPDRLMECLDAFEKYLHNKHHPTLIHIALCHYQFEAIHPFLDGNGRVGRLLITLLLVEYELLPAPLLYLSAFFEATRADYYQQLYNVSALGSWNDWLIYFLNGVILQSTDVLSRAEGINQLITNWQIKAGSDSTTLLGKIINHLAINPFVTAKKVVAQFGVAFTTAQRATKKLETLGVLKQVDVRKRNRVYCATQILNILEAPANLTHD